MLTVPTEIMVLMNGFAPLLDPRVWEYAKVLVIGAILAPRKRTVTSALRVTGLQADAQFQNYHRVLNRAVWSSLQVSKVLLALIVAAFVPPDAPVILVVDEKLERRKGKRIKALGYFRDPLRSSKKQAVISAGLRWLSMMLVAPVPWSRRPWALPFLTVLAPSEATDTAHGKRHKTAPRWIRQMLCQVRRWMPDRDLVVITDGGLVAIETGLHCTRLRKRVTYVAPLRLDARLFDPPGPQPGGKRGRKPRVGKRQPTLRARLHDPHTVWDTHEVHGYGGKRRTVQTVTGAALWYTPGAAPLPIRWILVRDPEGKLDPKACFATDPDAFPTDAYQPVSTLSPFQILGWYVMRWSQEVTFQETCAHLGFETQRQWNDRAIARTTPAILGLFAFVVLLAHHLCGDQSLPVQQAAWYVKKEATFSDVMVFVRQYLWTHVQFANSQANTRTLTIPADALHDVLQVLCHAA